MRYLSLLLLVILSCAACFSAQAEGPWRERLRQNIQERRGAHSALRPGDHHFTLQHQGRTRDYLVHVPPGIRADRPARVVVALHGGGGSMDFMAKDQYYGLITKSDQAGFIVVFPNGYSRLPGGKFATWNAGACCGDARDRNIDDVGFLKAVVHDLKGRLPIDQSGVFATGMSNGGLMAYRLACEASDVFAAIASVAGTDNTLACQPARPVPILHIHAQDDTHVLFQGGAGADSFRDVSKVTEFTSVPDTIKKWAAHNQCQGAPARVWQGNGAYCEQYQDCAGGAVVKLCVTESGGHSWPGGRKWDGQPTSSALSATEQIWDFFSQVKTSGR